MTPFFIDALLVLVFSALFAGILFVFSRNRKGQDAAKIHWRGLIPLALVGGLIVTFVFNLLERRVDKQPEDVEDILLMKPENRD